MWNSPFLEKNNVGKYIRVHIPKTFYNLDSKFHNENLEFVHPIKLETFFYTTAYIHIEGLVTHPIIPYIKMSLI